MNIRAKMPPEAKLLRLAVIYWATASLFNLASYISDHDYTPTDPLVGTGFVCLVFVVCYLALNFQNLLAILGLALFAPAIAYWGVFAHIFTENPELYLTIIHRWFAVAINVLGVVAVTLIVIMAMSKKLKAERVQLGDKSNIGSKQ